MRKQKISKCCKAKVVFSATGYYCSECKRRVVEWYEITKKEEVK